MIAIAAWTFIVLLVSAFFIHAFLDKRKAGGAPEPQKPVEPKDPDLEKPE